jgi:hypothetical protein
MKQGVAEAGSNTMADTAKRLANKDDGKVAKLRAAGDKKRDSQYMGTQIAKNDRTSKDEWGNLKQGVTETARMSAAAKLSKAWDQQQAKSAASRKRGQELLNPPKKEEPKTQPVSEKFHIFKRFKKTRKY